VEPAAQEHLHVGVLVVHPDEYRGPGARPGPMPGLNRAQKTNRISRIKMRIAAPMLMYMGPPWFGLGPRTQMTPL
jgi:hypothetical protein